MDDSKLLKKNLIMFPLGTVGRDMMYYLFNSCIMTYVLFTRSLTNAQFAAITAIVVAARVFDALNDPIMGNIIESTRSRWGKFKPWLTIGILLTSIVIYLAFNCNFQGWGFVWFFGIIYFSYSITYTMHDISYWGMVPALSSDANARNMFTSRATLFAGIGSTLAMVLIPSLTVGSGTIGGSTATAYGLIALVIAILGPLFLCFTIFGVREHRDAENKPAEKFSFRKILRVIAGNDQLRWISVIFVLQQVGNGMIAGGIGSTYVYFDFGYEGGLYSLFSIIGMMPTALLMIFYPTISRHIHRKPLMTIMTIFAGIGYAMMLAAAFFLPSTMVKFWVVTVGYAISAFGQYAFYLIMMISVINTVEYNEYKMGERDEALIASVRPFVTKLGSALIVLLTNLSYIVFGVTKYTNMISDFENQYSRQLITEAEKLDGIANLLNSVSAGKTTALLLCMSLLPFVLMLISYILYKHKYILDEEEYERICAELAKK